MNLDQERRNSLRIPLTRQAQLDFTSKVYEECLIQDLSLTGMFVHGDFQENVGDKCIVKLVQEGKHSYLYLESSAQVVRNDDEGVAIAFTSMPLESLLLLQMILHCKDGTESLGRGIQSIDDLPFKVNDELLR